MNIKQKKEGDKLTVSIEGSIDTNTAPVLMDFLETAMIPIAKLVLDFEKVDYISSAGLRVLLYAQKTMSIQGEMELVNVNEEIMEIFEITGFTSVITVQ